MGLIDELKKKLEPTDALIFYSCDNDKYVEHRKITNGQMGAGQPLTVEQVSKLVHCVEKYAKKQKPMARIGGVIPKNLLYASTDLENMRLVWWRGPEERKVFFREDLGIPNGTMKVPGMVYMASNETLSVWCFKGRTPRGVLYRAPFFNVYSDGHVCLGNSKTDKPKSNTYEEWLLYWEKMFWQSEFSHMISDNPIEGNLSTETKRCIVDGKPFDTDKLKKSNKKINDLLKV